MFIRTRQLDGFIFYLGSDPFKSAKKESGVRSAKPQIFKPVGSIGNEATGLSNITCELTKGTLLVTITGGDGKTKKAAVFSAILSNGYRHFIRVVRQNNLMTVKVNETIIINQDFPVAPTFIIEKLYLGNYPVEKVNYVEDVGDDIFGNDNNFVHDQSSQPTFLSTNSNTNSATENKLPLNTESTITPPTSSERSTHSINKIQPITESNLINEAVRPGLSTVPSDKSNVEGNLNLGETPQNEILSSIPSNRNQNELKSIRPPRVLEDTEIENSQINDERAFSTAPLSSNPVPSIALSSTGTSSEEGSFRERRDTSTSSVQINKLFFKGIIQDVQISNGDKRNSRIVELFEQEFDAKTNLNLPLSVGPVQWHNIKEGEISDNTCKTNPCKNNGTCHVTWNDYRCECKEGWKGRKCNDKEYCFWNKCPADESTCVSRSDGYECLTNATFNGISSSVSVRPENFPNSSYSSLLENTIKVTFRSKYIKSGTILHIVGGEDYADKYVRISIQNELLSVEIPEGDIMVNKSLSGNVLSGSWQTVEVTFFVLPTATVKARLNDGKDEFISLGSTSLGSTLDFAHFVSTSKDIIIGSSTEIKGSNYNNQKDVYTSEEISNSSFESIQIHTEINGKKECTNFFRGCIGQVRIGGVLLPFYKPSQLNETNFPDKKKFLTTEINNLDDTGCTLCYQQECLNSGTCTNPDETFECTCPAGFEDQLCKTNIDECATSNACKYGKCIDGIANYTFEK